MPAGGQHEPAAAGEQLGSAAIVGHAPIDSVEEFRSDVAGNEAASGPGSGGQFELVTKSGTNTFHGNLNEYHRDPSLVANSWFGNNATPKVPRNHLIQNQFGGNIGGPVILPKLFNGHDKLFFFFDYGNSKIISSRLVSRTVPLDSLRDGEVGYSQCTDLDSAGNCSPSNDPANDVVNYATAAQLKALDPQGIGVDTNWQAFTNGRFPHSNANGGDGVNSGGYTFNAPDNDYETNYIGRVDYNINDKMKAFAKFSIVRENAVQNPNEFGGDPVTNPVIDRSYTFVLGHTWLIGPTMTNRIGIGETVQKLDFPNTYNPKNAYNFDGTTFYTFGTGVGAALASSLYLQPSYQARRIPVPILRDDFNWTKGTHNWQIGGSFKNILAHTTNAIDYNTTYLGLGGLNTALSANVQPSDIDPQDTFSFDQGYTYLLGRIGQVLSDYNYDAKGNVLPQLSGDQRMYRYYQTQLYAQDSWKMSPGLTVTYGLTYQLFSVPYETRGLESIEPFTFDQYMQARVQQSSLSQTGPGAVPLIAYYLGGKGNGSSAPPLYKPEYRNMAPHVGFVWNPSFDKKMVINASGGIVYDRTVISAVQGLQDNYSYLFQQTKPNVYGNADGRTALLNDPRLDSGNVLPNSANPSGSLTAPATPSQPYEPFVSNGVPFGLTTFQAYNATIDPSLKTPYNIIFNAGIQSSLPQDMIIKVSYAGRLGRRLLAQADANQVLEFPDPVSGQLFSDAFAAITLQARAGVPATSLTAQPWFENVLPPGTVAAVNAPIIASNAANPGNPPSPLASNNTQAVAINSSFGFVQNGDIGDFVAFNLAPLAPANVGSSAQFSENSFFTNKGFSTYHGLLVTLQKNRSHGVNFDLNYTFQHSIDNISFFANSQGDTGIGGIGLICDVVRPRECRSNSDFDIKQVISSDAGYELPFGKGKMFAGSTTPLVNEIIGDWSLSGIASWHTGQAWGTVSNAFVASFANDAPAILIGPRKNVQTHLTKLPGGGVNVFKDNLLAASSYGGPVGFNIGARNGLRGPGFFNADLGLGKTFPIVGEKVSVKFRADAFNALNHPNFTIPAENGFNGYDQDDFEAVRASRPGKGFGQSSFTVTPPGNLNNGARVLQLSLRLEF